MLHLPLDIINELQFYMGNDRDVDKLEELSNNEMIRYHHNTINYQDVGDKRRDRILKLKIHHSDDIVNLSEFKNLIYLDCIYNNLTSLPVLPSELERLHCYNNKLTSLPMLPSGLKILYCSCNKLTSLPTLPSGLKELSCRRNKLTSLPTLPSGLKEFECSDNKLSILPELPSGFRELNCSHNELTILGVLPSGLEELNCYGNKLTSLPTLPSGLVKLNCGYGNNIPYKIIYNIKNTHPNLYIYQYLLDLGT